MREVSQEHLDALCPELRAVVQDAAAAGNPVVETWTGWGDVVALQRARPLLVDLRQDVRASLTYTRTDDPHHWVGEVRCRLHPGWFVVLPFTPEARDAGSADLGLPPPP